MPNCLRTNLDLSDLASVETFATEAADQFDRIDVLMNNRGGDVLSIRTNH